jgi:hypothetical protein
MDRDDRRDVDGQVDWTKRFLTEAFASGEIDAGTYRRLLTRLAAARAEAKVPVTTGGPRTVVTAPSVPPMPPIPPMPAYRPAPPPSAPVPGRPGHIRVPAAPPVPSPVRDWIARAREAIASDLGVHGLAYLGVLLVFAGALGFFLFSFGTMSHAVRPFAELAIPTVLFGSAWYLHRRGAPVVATAMGLVAGVLLPVVLFASFVDGVAFPPDMHGTALAAALAITSILLAVAYSVVAIRWPDASVRYLVAPLVWTALWGIGLALQPGEVVRLNEWGAWPFALAAVGVAGTAAFARARPDSSAAHDASPTIIPGALVTLGLGLLLARSEGWPWVPSVVVCLASLLTSELVAPRLETTVVQIVQPALLWLAVAALGYGKGDITAGVTGVLGSLALLEWQARRRPGGIPILAGVLGVVAGIGLTSSDPWAMVATAGVTATWAHVRRIWPVAGPEAARVAAIATALAALVFAAALVEALPDGTAVVTLGALALATSIAARFLRPQDAFLMWWTFWAALLVVALTLAPELRAGEAAIAAGFSAGALAVNRMPVAARAWIVVPTLAWTAWLALDAAGVPIDSRAASVAIAAALLTAVVTWRKGVAEHVAAAAVIVSGLAFAAVPGGWLRFNVLCVLVGAVGSVTVAGELREVGVTDLLVRVGAPTGTGGLGRIVPPALLLAGLAGLCLVASDVSGLLNDRPEIVSVLLTGLALAEAGATWLVRRRSPLRSVVAIGSFALAIAGAVMAAGEPRPSALALGLSIATVAALAPESRWEPMSWTAWTASFLLVARIAELGDLPIGDAALAVAGWSAVLLVGGLALDDRQAGRRVPGGFVRVRGLVAPVVLGAIGFLPALALAMPGSDARVAAVATGGALVIAVVAIQLSIGALTAGTYVLLTLAAAVLSPYSAFDRPESVLPWAVALLLVALATRTVSGELEPVRRWDLPPFAMAHAVVLFGLAQSAQLDELAVTWIGAGALALAVALVLRAPAWGSAAALLVTVGAIDAGPGWGALALAGCAAGVALLAATIPTEAMSARKGLQAVAALAAGGALVELGRYLDWSMTELATAGLLLAALATITGLVVWATRPDLPWAAQAGALALAFNLLAAGAATTVWPDRAPLVGVLLLLAAQTAGAGIVLHRGALLMAVPPLACAAWLVGAGDVLQGSIQWSSVPIGIAALVVVAIGRWDRRRRGEPVVDQGLVTLEYAGMAAVVAPSLVETVTISPVHGLVALAFGVALATWGLVTKVRRRLLVGAAAAIGAIALLLVGPIARLVPRVKGPGLWILLVVVGLALIIIATSLERGRTRISAALKRLDQLLSGWE